LAQLSPSTAAQQPCPLHGLKPAKAARSGGLLYFHPSLGKKSQRDLRAFYESSRRMITLRRVTGAEAILAARCTLAGGRTPPRDGITCSF